MVSSYDFLGGNSSFSASAGFKTCSSGFLSGIDLCKDLPILVGDNIFSMPPPQHYHISMKYSSMDAHCFSWGLWSGVVGSALDFKSEGRGLRSGSCHGIIFFHKKICSILFLSTQVTFHKEVTFQKMFPLLEVVQTCHSLLFPAQMSTCKLDATAVPSVHILISPTQPTHT